MISRESFDRLKPGDVILYNGKPRTVRYVHNGTIAFSIWRRSWTGRISTYRTYSELKNICSLPRKKRERIELCRAEEETLLANGFRIIPSLEREIRKDTACLERMRSVYEKSQIAAVEESIRYAKYVLRKLKRRVRR